MRSFRVCKELLLLREITELHWCIIFVPHRQPLGLGSGGGTAMCGMSGREDKYSRFKLLFLQINEIIHHRFCVHVALIACYDII
jgi:hypothetical protein